jgi:rare lipoprotein A
LECALSLNLKSFGKVLFLVTFASTVMSCSIYGSKVKSSNNKAEINFDEQPKILNISASAIWDGTQTLGGNWISHPDVDSPERVIIKNISNGKSVVGAVFQQTKNLNNGSVAISSDAAKALNISKNDETKLQIVAIRLIENSKVNSDEISTNMEKTPTTVAKLAKPFIQVGIFGVKSNAIKTGDQMVKLGLPVNTFDFKIKEKTYWRVIAGPAISLENRQNMLTNIKSAGFKDAYFVSN